MGTARKFTSSRRTFDGNSKNIQPRSQGFSLEGINAKETSLSVMFVLCKYICASLQ